MDALSSAASIAWVLLWLAVVGICVPAMAIGRSSLRSTIRSEFGPALVSSWLTIAVGVSLVATVRGFNWVTALLVSVAWPTTLWMIRNRGAHRLTIRNRVRSIVFRAVSPQHTWRGLGLPEGAMALLALPMLAMLPLLIGRADIRLPTAVDFDTLWRTRRLLEGSLVWDPLASLAAVLVRLASTDALHVAAALRLALVALTAAAAAVLIVEMGRPRWAAVSAALAIALFAPQAPAATWGVALVALIASTSLMLFVRERHPRDGRQALAAGALLIGQLCPFWSHPEVLLRVSQKPQFFEHRSAAVEALRLMRRQSDDNWVIVGPPELRLEVDRDGHFYDLARFVTQAHDRSGNSAFRFDVPARRLFVFTEMQPFETGTAPGVQFIAAQQAAYRVPRARRDLQRLARKIVDDYRRTHVGASIVYDDGALRVYGIDR